MGCDDIKVHIITFARNFHIKASDMRHGPLLVRCVKPSTWAHATRLTCAPRQELLRPCAIEVPISGQRRLIQSNSSPDDSGRLAQNDQIRADGVKHGSVGEGSQIVELDLETKSSPAKPKWDHSWVSRYTGDHIESVNGKALKGTEDYVSHQSGTKLLCSWNLGPGEKKVIWVPGKYPSSLVSAHMSQYLAHKTDSARFSTGDAPRVRDVKLPMDLKPESMQEVPNSDWALGNPQASFEPFFASLATMNPQANFDNTDVIARAGTLLLLLGVARGNLKQLGAAHLSVAFQIALVKNTLIIKRIQHPTKGNALGRGLTPTMTGGFAKTIAEMRASENDINPDHSQAVRYDLAHLRCVVVHPVDAATGNTSLPPLTVPDKSQEIPQLSESIQVRRGGRGVPPGAVTKFMTGFMGYESNGRKLNYKGQLKIKPAGLAKIWFERPKAILQGHLEPAPPGAAEGTLRLARVSVRETRPMLDQTENACQLELRRMVTLLDRLRDTARRAGGSCVLICLPEQESESGGAKVSAKFEVYKSGPDAERLVLDWHVERFWSE